MLDFGFSEILLTSAIALVVLGPERLPKVARQVGNWMGRARLMARQLHEQLEREVSADELLKERTRTATSVVPDRTAAPPPLALAPGEQPQAASSSYVSGAPVPDAPPQAAAPGAQELAQSSASHGAPGAPASNPPNE